MVSGCRSEEPIGPDVVARIGGAEVRYGEFERSVARTVGDDEGVLASDVLSRLFDQFVDEELLARLAAERGLQAASRRGAADALLREALARPVGEHEVGRYYAAHRGEFSRPERVRLRQILVEDRAAAERARAEVVGGADFAAVARRVSRDPSAPRGGLQGELSRRDLPASFAAAIFGLAEGEVSAIVPADYGFHLF
ncbi:MAG TPA: peptidylprolyl isomerase, partial [Thermoanaerobaculia bacterium]|nr:peptidylprolyl isomerase [Thermoanaerobaculia bacterium]